MGCFYNLAIGNNATGIWEHRYLFEILIPFPLNIHSRKSSFSGLLFSPISLAISFQSFLLFLILPLDFYMLRFLRAELFLLSASVGDDLYFHRLNVILNISLQLSDVCPIDTST